MLDRPWEQANARVGLVLGAGGARGFAHIGALKVIERRRVPVDLVVGSSMGSLIGAAYAAGLSADVMEQAVRSTRFRPMFRPRIGRSGLVDPTGVGDAIRRLLGDRRFEDLACELAILTASVRTGEPIVLREGSLADAVLASIAIPILFPPVLLGADQLVDGGMIAGLPVKLARQLGADVVLAVDADNHARRVLRAPVLRHLTCLLACLLGARPPRDGLGARVILSRVLHHMVERSEEELADILIQPRFGRITSFHYHLAAHCIGLGETAATAALGELVADDVAEAPELGGLEREALGIPVTIGGAAGFELSTSS